MSPPGGNHRSTDIAIIGMSGRFPGARNLAEFWRNLQDGVESITFFSDEDLSRAGVPTEKLKDPAYVKAAGVLQQIEYFDAGFFGMNPREAEIADPQQRLFLECAWEALEDAGYDPAAYGGAIGVYAGTGASTYWLHLASDRQLMSSISTQIAYGNEKDYLATTVSYKMNLRGPSITVQTACSTSLVAVHLACQALLNGECDMALAGGAKVKAQQFEGYNYREGGISARDGHCRAFDERADGTVWGNGVGVVTLKRLDDALSDRDPIRAVIKGSAINNDGSMKIGYTAPSIKGQASVIAEALALAGVSPDSITYVETHGTGTHLGDPIEIKALTQVFRATSQKKGFCAIGSVKTNIGHLDTAAGIAGLVKAVLALEHKLIPPSLNYDKPNPLLDLESSPFRINTRLVPWQSNGTPRRAGVSSFGIGGTNAHVVLEEAPRMTPPASTRPCHLLVISARSKETLDRASKQLLDHLREHPSLPLADVAYTLQLGRRAFNQRRCVVCAELSDAVKILAEGDRRRLMSGSAPKDSVRVAFMFSGQGTQRVQMGRDLYRYEPCFKESIDRCAHLLEQRLGCDIRNVLYPAPSEERAAANALGETKFAQPALFVTEYALTQWLMKCGIKPAAMIGHSVGEYVAACISGVFGLEDALALVAERGRLMQEMPGGAMLAVHLGEEDVRTWLRPGLWLAAVNGPNQCVVSGYIAEIGELEHEFKREGVPTKRLATQHAFHSGLMDGMLGAYGKALLRVNPTELSVPFVSNLTGGWMRGEDAKDTSYWLKQIREPVRFGAGLLTLMEDHNLIFLEVGPGETLCRLGRSQAPRSVFLGTLGTAESSKQSNREIEKLQDAIGRLWLNGVHIDWLSLYENEQRHRVSVPTYPFDRERYWIDRQAIDDASTVRTDVMPGSGSDVSKRKDIADWFYVPVWKQALCPEYETNERGTSWLVFASGDSVSRGLTQKLREAGKSVTVVEIGDCFAVSGDTYQIDPSCRAHYVDLIEALLNRREFPRTVVHLWSLAARPLRGDRVGAFSRAQGVGFYSLVYLAEALGRVTQRDAQLPRIGEILIGAVSEQTQDITGDETLRPEKATMLGACKTIPKQHRDIVCRSIDILKPRTGTQQERRTIRHLIGELSRNSKQVAVAYRGRHRWVQDYEPVCLTAERENRGPLRIAGVYLITGGLGRIGLELAGYLCCELNAKVVLVGRRTLPPRSEWERHLQEANCSTDVGLILARLLELDRSGGEVWLETADVADESAMRRVVGAVKSRWGGINGVIHAAGMSPRAAETSEVFDRERCEEQFRSKALGALVLKRVLEGEELDWCLLVSSLRSVTGGRAGFAGLAAASQFLDTLARTANRRRDRAWISVDWEDWGFDESPSSGDPQGSLLLTPTGLTRAGGVQSFARVLKLASTAQVIVSSRDLRARLETFSSSGRQFEKASIVQASKRPLHRRPELNSAYEEPADTLETQIVKMWEDLLGIESVGVRDDFFELGGHSLLTTQLGSRIRSTLEVEVPLRSLFERPTVREMAGLIRSLEGTRASGKEIVRVKRDGPLPLSFSQQRLWFIHQLEPDSAAYNIPMAVRLSGELKVAAVEQSLGEVMRRHEVLRTRFEMRQEQAVQVIEGECGLELRVWDVRGLPVQRREESARAILKEESWRGFDLEQGPVVRAGLVRVRAEEHVLVVVMHHIASDGWSIGVLVREFSEVYRAYSEGKPSELAELEIQYADYAVWQREWLRGGVEDDELGYWRRQLAEAPILELPTDRPRPPVASHRGATVEWQIPSELTQRLRRLSQQEGVTLFMTLLAAFKLVLSQHSGQSDIVVGTDVANRGRVETERLIGFFVNQLVLRTDLKGNPTVKDLLARVRETTLGAYSRQDLPFERLVQDLVHNRDLSRSPLFQVKLVYQNAPRSSLQVAGTNVSGFRTDYEFAKYDLTIILFEGQSIVSGWAEYATELYDGSTIERLLADFHLVLERITADVEKSINDLLLFDTPQERNELRCLEQQAFKVGRRRAISPVA
jgi:acyl transferase domain-containing protein